MFAEMIEFAMTQQRKNGFYNMKLTKEARSWRNRVNNAQGRLFEQQILAGCEYYKINDIAFIEKTPEPFSVIKKNKDGSFIGRFSKNKRAQPDFKGTLCNGNSIVFEAKYTSKDYINFNVLTETQYNSLLLHYKLGAKVFVCVGMQDKFYFVPFDYWRYMKECGCKKLYLGNLITWECLFDGTVRFLRYKDKTKPEQMSLETWKEYFDEN